MTVPVRPLLAVRSDTSVPTGLGWYEVATADAPFNLARFTVEVGYATPVDSHAVHEIWFVATGTGEMHYADGQVLRIAEGDAVYIEPPKVHQVFNNGEGPLVVHSIYWEGQP
jgi:mannose-6-phosphate isomerase-like protein (cupin superfamily)